MYSVYSTNKIIRIAIALEGTVNGWNQLCFPVYYTPKLYCVSPLEALFTLRSFNVAPKKILYCKQPNTALCLYYDFETKKCWPTKPCFAIPVYEYGTHDGKPLNHALWLSFKKTYEEKLTQSLSPTKHYEMWITRTTPLGCLDASRVSSHTISVMPVWSVRVAYIIQYLYQTKNLLLTLACKKSRHCLLKTTKLNYSMKII